VKFKEKILKTVKSRAILSDTPTVDRRTQWLYFDVTVLPSYYIARNTPTPFMSHPPHRVSKRLLNQPAHIY